MLKELHDVGLSNKMSHCQEPITRSLHTHYILESTFARIFLFLEQSQENILLDVITQGLWLRVT